MNAPNILRNTGLIEIFLTRNRLGYAIAEEIKSN